LIDLNISTNVKRKIAKKSELQAFVFQNRRFAEKKPSSKKHGRFNQ